MNLLVPYSATNKKIVMGLLSYIPEFKDFKRLQEEIEEIATNPLNAGFLKKVTARILLD